MVYTFDNIEIVIKSSRVVQVSGINTTTTSVCVCVCVCVWGGGGGGGEGRAATVSFS